MRPFIGKRSCDMSKPTSLSNKKSYQPTKIELRKQHNLSQCDLAHKLQLTDYDIDKKRIESCIYKIQSF